MLERQSCLRALLTQAGLRETTGNLAGDDDGTTRGISITSVSFFYMSVRRVLFSPLPGHLSIATRLRRDVVSAVGEFVEAFLKILLLSIRILE